MNLIYRIADGMIFRLPATVGGKHIPLSVEPRKLPRLGFAAVADDTIPIHSPLSAEPVFGQYSYDGQMYARRDVAIRQLAIDEVRANALTRLETNYQAVIDAGYRHPATEGVYKIDILDLAGKYFAAKEGLLDRVEVRAIDETARMVSATVFQTVAGYVLTALRTMLARKEARQQDIREATTIAEILAVDLKF